MNDSSERQKLFFSDILTNSKFIVLSSNIYLARDQGNDELALFKRTAYFAQNDNQA